MGEKKSGTCCFRIFRAWAGERKKTSKKFDVRGGAGRKNIVRWLNGRRRFSLAQNSNIHINRSCSTWPYFMGEKNKKVKREKNKGRRKEKVSGDGTLWCHLLGQTWPREGRSGVFFRRIHFFTIHHSLLWKSNRIRKRISINFRN